VAAAGVGIQPLHCVVLEAVLAVWTSLFQMLCCESCRTVSLPTESATASVAPLVYELALQVQQPELRLASGGCVLDWLVNFSLHAQRRPSHRRCSSLAASAPNFASRTGRRAPPLPQARARRPPRSPVLQMASLPRTTMTSTVRWVHCAAPLPAPFVGVRNESAACLRAGIPWDAWAHGEARRRILSRPSRGCAAVLRVRALCAEPQGRTSLSSLIDHEPGVGAL
jgi:hypothetical protein